MELLLAVPAISHNSEVSVSKLTTGVYCIQNRVNGKRYVGSASVSLKKRIREHKDALRAGTSHNRYLQRAWNKYGEDQFDFSVLEYCVSTLCISREQYWIDFYEATNPNKGYNLCPNAGNTLGLKQSEEHRRKTREALLKRGPVSEETRKKRSLSLKGHSVSEEVKAKLRASRLGKKLSEETKKKISEAGKGKTWKWSEESKKKQSELAKRRPPMTEETKRKMSISKMGKIPSKETREKLSKSLKGHKVSETTRLAISKANTGKIHTEEHRKKNSDFQKQRYKSEEERKRTAELTSLAIRNDPQKIENRRKAGKASWENRRKKLLTTVSE